MSFAKKGVYTERLFLKVENRKDIRGDFYNYDKRLQFMFSEKRYEKVLWPSG